MNALRVGKAPERMIAAQTIKDRVYASARRGGRMNAASMVESVAATLGEHRIAFLDEAQRIPGVGLTLKIITDQFPEVQLLVSGSSSFDMASELNEPLTGRKWEYTLFPVSWREFEDHVGYLNAEQQLETRLLFGSYPEIVTSPPRLYRNSQA